MLTKVPSTALKRRHGLIGALVRHAGFDRAKELAKPLIGLAFIGLFSGSALYGLSTGRQEIIMEVPLTETGITACIERMADER